MTYVIHKIKEIIHAIYIFDRSYTMEGISDITNTSYSYTFDKSIQDGMNETTKVYVIRDTLYQDDSMDTIKKKIAHYIQEKDVQPYDIYTYGFQKKKINSVSLFQELKEPKKEYILQEHLNLYLNNCVPPFQIPDKPYITLEDIMQLQLENIDIQESFPMSFRYSHPFVISNMQALLNMSIDQFNDYINRLTQHAEWNTLMQTENYELLLHYPMDGPIYINIKQDIDTIFEDVLSYETFIQLYFPFSSKDIKIPDNFQYIFI